MTDNNSHEPILASPVALAATKPAVAGLSVIGTALIIGVATHVFYEPSSSSMRPPPSSVADLSTNVVTIVPADDAAGIASAVSALQLPKPQRESIERALLTQDKRIGWMVFVDSIDPDGDIVAVEAARLTQNITLSKTWTPVAVPLVDGGPIGVTAVKDGGGGGVTVALATKSGPVAFRIMRPGERIEVVP